MGKKEQYSTSKDFFHQQLFSADERDGEWWQMSDEYTTSQPLPPTHILQKFWNALWGHLFNTLSEFLQYAKWAGTENKKAQPPPPAMESEVNDWRWVCRSTMNLQVPQRPVWFAPYPSQVCGNYHSLWRTSVATHIPGLFSVVSLFKARLSQNGSFMRIRKFLSFFFVFCSILWAKSSMYHIVGAQYLLNEWAIPSANKHGTEKD